MHAALLVDCRLPKQLPHSFAPRSLASDCRPSKHRRVELLITVLAVGRCWGLALEALARWKN